MSKNLFQDMVKIKNDKKNKISKTEVADKVPDQKIKKENINIKNKEIQYQEPKYEYSIDEFNKDRKNKSYFGLWIFVIVSLVFLFFTLTNFFTRATVVIQPKIENISLNDSFKATKDLNVIDEGFSYQLMILEDVLDNNVPSQGEVNVEEKAKGKVVLYNAFSNTAQTIDINTRLESVNNNKIYKTTKKVSIPGLSSDGIPGSVEVEIIAEQAGDLYNQEFSDFYIYGFRNTPKYKKIYGRSLGKIEGGFKGKKNIVKDEDKEKVLTETKLSLENILFKKALEQIPKGYILFKNASFFEFEDDIVFSGDPKDNQALLKVKGKISAFLFKEDNFKENMLRIKSPKQDPKNVYLLSARDLNFVLENQPNNFSELSEINFKLSGNVYVVSFIDEKILQDRLLGQKKSKFNNVLNRYPNIENADLTIKPFWVNSIPESKEKLKIIVNYPK